MCHLHLFRLFTFAAVLTACNQSVQMKPPVAAKKNKALTIHGHTRIDEYYWLNERNNPEVISYLEAENAYTETVMKDYAPLREKLFEEMKGRIKQDDATVPYKKNGYWYYTRYEEGKEYPIYCRKKETLEAPEEILLNVNQLAEGKTYCHVSGIFVSPNNKLLCYGIDTVSRRLYSIVIKDIESGRIIESSAPATTGSVAWANDNASFFYTQKDPVTLRSYKIFKHVTKQSFDTDTLIYHEKDETFATGTFRSKSGKYIFIGSYASTSNEFRFINADKPDAAFKIVQKRTQDLEYAIEHMGDYFYIHTNYKAINFRLMKCPVNATGIDNWIEVIAHRNNVFIQDVELFSNRLVLSERHEGLTNLRIIDWQHNTDIYVDFGEKAYTAELGQNPDFDSPYLRYNYSSLTTPNSVFDYNMESREKVLKKQQEVVGGFRPEDYYSERLRVVARDGEIIPVSLVYKRSLKNKAGNPLLLYGYGSYGHSIDPYFSPARLSLLDRGFIFAIAHIRGGQEMGRPWYDNGKLLKKMNTFNDFIDCAEHLISSGYTKPSQLFAMGGSAGGLLVGAVANMRPDLFRGIIAAVPFVDVVTTMLDESIPLTTGEYDEWGNPNNEEYYRYMLSYSPYDNVKPGPYPAMLVTTGLHDSQVQYWEPAKWVARLRANKTDNNLLLLKTDMSTGHGGASGRFEAYRDNALQYAFMLKILGIHE